MAARPAWIKETPASPAAAWPGRSFPPHSTRSGALDAWPVLGSGRPNGRQGSVRVLAPATAPSSSVPTLPSLFAATCSRWQHSQRGRNANPPSPQEELPVHDGSRPGARRLFKAQAFVKEITWTLCQRGNVSRRRQIRGWPPTLGPAAVCPSREYWRSGRRGPPHSRAQVPGQMQPDGCSQLRRPLRGPGIRSSVPGGAGA